MKYGILQRLEKSFYIQLWIPTIVVYYFIIFFTGSIYSNNAIFLAVILSLALIVILSIILPSFYQNALDEDATKVAQNSRIGGLEFKAHSICLILLIVIHIICLNINAT